MKYFVTLISTRYYRTEVVVDVPDDAKRPQNLAIKMGLEAGSNDDDLEWEYYDGDGVEAVAVEAVKGE